MATIETGDPADDVDRLLTEQEAADRLRVCARTLQRMDSAKIGPTRLRVGRIVRYSEAEIRRYISAQQERTPSGGTP